eukprot:2728560-Alexandrium_andersonii.AAC.1
MFGNSRPDAPVGHRPQLARLGERRAAQHAWAEASEPNGHPLRPAKRHARARTHAQKRTRDACRGGAR